MYLPINKHLTTKLDNFCKTKIIPNILFHGSSGCGKKTIVLDFVSRIYNNNIKIIKDNVLFINCSQGKGIKFIREELKPFAKYNIHVSHEIPFKTIIMLNFDNLSIDAQSVMRRIIELFINTRFFIIVENKYKLLNPIISRFCSIYIPEHIIDGKIINLHQYTLNNIINNKCISEYENEKTQKMWKNETFTHSRKENEKIINEPHKYILNIINNIQTKCIITECSNLYEMGISCIDLINTIKIIDTITDINKSEIIMRFYILKKEYRCEKLLMFHIISLLHTKF